MMFPIVCTLDTLLSLLYYINEVYSFSIFSLHPYRYKLPKTKIIDTYTTAPRNPVPGGGPVVVTSCPAGQETNSGNTACTACTAGKISAAKDLTPCTACTSPKVANPAKTACEDPPAPVVSNGKVLMIGDSYVNECSSYEPTLYLCIAILYGNVY
jgi:hypothetical protein